MLLLQYALETHFGDIILKTGEVEIYNVLERYVVNKNDGSLIDSNSHIRCVTFKVNPKYIYYATGRTTDTEDGCGVAYFSIDGTYLEYELPGGKPENFEDYKLSVPENAYYVKINSNIYYYLASLRVVGELDIIEDKIQNVSLKQRQNLSQEEVDAVLKNIVLRTGQLIHIDIVSSYAISKVDGSYLESVSDARILTYEIINPNGNYVASGRITNNTDYCSIAYYDIDGNYLGYELEGGTAKEFRNYKLCVPENAYYVKIYSNAKYTLSTLQLIGTLDNIEEKIGNIEENTGINSLNGKTIAIIGSSIHTGGNDGDHPNAVEIEITSEDIGVELSAYLTYVDVQNNLTLGGTTFDSSQIGTEVTFIPTAEDVGKKIGLPRDYNGSNKKVWWLYIKESFTNVNIIPVCWSGAGFTRNRQSSQLYVTSYAWHESQIRKCGIRIPGTMNRTAPDVIILARGINDMSYEPYARLTDGYFDNPNYQYPTDDSVGDGIYGFKEGIMTTISKLRAAYPFTKIIIATTTPFKRVNKDHYPSNNGLYNQQQYNNALREVADFCGIEVLDFNKCGITWENMYPTYIDDSASTPTHPNEKGYEVMGKFAVNVLRSMNFDM